MSQFIQKVKTTLSEVSGNVLFKKLNSVNVRIELFDSTFEIVKSTVLISKTVYVKCTPDILFEILMYCTFLRTIPRYKFFFVCSP